MPCSHELDFGRLNITSDLVTLRDFDSVSLSSILPV